MFSTQSFVIGIANVMIAMLVLVRTMHSHVLNTCPGRDIHSLRAYADVQELSLIFYYVSWNNDALHVKTVYEEVANYYGQHVHFAAVDCWHITCNCSSVNRWSQPTQQWPKLIVHHAGRLSLQYTGHEWSFMALRQFVDKQLHPLIRVHSKAEVKHWNMLSDGVVLGMFGGANERAYASYVHAAIKWLEIDPVQAFRFTVAVGESTHDIINERGGGAQKPRLLFINAKGIDVFNGTKWDSTQIVLWLQHRMKRVFRDLYSYTTPTTLALRLQHGPALNIFTAYEPAAKFYAEMWHAYQTVLGITQPKYCDLQGITVIPRVVGGVDDAHCATRQYMQHTDLPRYYQINEYLKTFSFKSEPFGGSHYDHNSNHNNIENTPSQIYKDNLCFRGDDYYMPERKVTIAKFLKRSVDIVRDEHSQRLSGDFPQNRTLTVNILDRHRDRDLLRSLGLSGELNSTATTKTTTVFIADPLSESLYVMDSDDYSYTALMDFLRRYYDSPSSIGRHWKMAPRNADPAKDVDRPAIAIAELNAGEFNEVVQRQVNCTFVVLLYTPECTVSNIMSHTLIQVAALLRHNSDLRIVRVNVKANDLPWQFKMADSPNLLVFPRGRRRDESVYPKNIKINVPNVYAFVVKHLEAADQIRTVVRTCKLWEQTTASGVQKCLHYVKNLAVHHIGRHLKRWQFHESERHLLYDRLQELKQLNYAIQRNALV